MLGDARMTKGAKLVKLWIGEVTFLDQFDSAENGQLLKLLKKLVDTKMTIGQHISSSCQ